MSDQKAIYEAAEVLLKFIEDNHVEDEVRFDGEKVNRWRSSHFQKLIYNLRDAFDALTNEDWSDIKGALLDVSPDPNIERIADSLEGIKRILNHQFGYTVVHVDDIPDAETLHGRG
jgi:hypothetical protein